MNICKIDGYTRILGAPANWDQSQVECVGLPIVDRPDGWMVSQWRPTDEELQALIEGGSVRLWVMRPGHPVVSVEAIAADETQVSGEDETQLKEQVRWLRHTLTQLQETMTKQMEVCKLALGATE